MIVLEELFLQVHQTIFSDIISNVMMLGPISIDLWGFLLIEQDATLIGATGVTFPKDFYLVASSNSNNYHYLIQPN